jgi:hypothetical protein
MRDTTDLSESSGRHQTRQRFNGEGPRRFSEGESQAVRFATVGRRTCRVESPSAGPVTLTETSNTEVRQAMTTSRSARAHPRHGHDDNARYCGPVENVDASPAQPGLGKNKVDQWLLEYLGPLCWWLKEHWVFAAITFAAVVATPSLLYFVPKTSTNEHQPWILTVVVLCAVAGGLAVLGDKLADRYESKLTAQESAGAEDDSERSLRAAELSFQQSVSELNWLLEMALRIPFLEDDAKANQVETVRDDVVKAVAGAVGPGTRATYYTLETDGSGSRRLCHPKHALTIGRSDRPEREWVEAENPGHEMWTLLGRSDSEPAIVRFPADADGLDWSKVEYRCFVSVPVRARTATFGLLSVNAAGVGTLRETERALILTAARILALVEATNVGPAEARSRLNDVRPRA